MATLNDSVLDSLHELSMLRDRATQLRERGRKALCTIPDGLDYHKLEKDCDLSDDHWVSGPHPIDLALLVRVLNHRDLGDYEFDAPDELTKTLATAVTNLFSKDGDSDLVPTLTAARAMHALVGSPQTVFSTATMLCYYRIVRELYLATFPNWVIGAARAGEGGRVSAFVTGECVRAILAFSDAIRHTITFFATTKRLFEECERLNHLPKVDEHLKVRSKKETSNWATSLDIEYERIALDWCAANNLRRNIIALDLSADSSANAGGQPEKPTSLNVSTPGSKKHNGTDIPFNRSSLPSLFPLEKTTKLGSEDIKTVLDELPKLLSTAISRARDNILKARDLIESFRAKEAGLLEDSDIKDLNMLAEALTDQDRIKEGGKYHEYVSALTDQTLENVAAHVRNGHSTGTSQPTIETDDENLRRALVHDLNKTFTERLLIGGEDRQKLKARVEGAKSAQFEKFTPETESLVERHFALIKSIVNENKVPAGGSSELIQLNRSFLEDAFSEDRGGTMTCPFNRIDRRRFDASVSAHDLALGVIREALEEAEIAATAMERFEENRSSQEHGQAEEDFKLPRLLDKFISRHKTIQDRIQRAIGPTSRYIQNVLNSELARAANSAKFDAGELLFAATCFGALNGWKQNEQVAQARRLLTQLWPDDGRLQTSRPFQSTAKGFRLIPIAFEMTRCFAQLMQKHFAEDLDPKVVRKILNAFEENPIALSPGDNEKVGWNFRGAPESQKPSVWVTTIAVFALDRTVRMLNERINAMVLRHFNVDWPSSEVDSLVGSGSTSGGKLGLNELMYGDYELQSAFTKGKNHEQKYKKDPPRVDRVSIAIRLQQMRAHLTRALLPNFYTPNSPVPIYKKAYSAIFYGPHGTGKTTLAEALAATAKVPLVRLSPSDLMVQGTDVIESRARAIFDSLSMLTKAVIFLDEFEPVVRTRRQTGKKQEDSPPDPPEFRFLVTGMLPKLIKLNKAAEKQSVVYCLATNYLIQVDDAARRIGRFDLQIPIYHPDPMSRVGVFLYRLITVLQKEQKKSEEQQDKWKDELDELLKKPIFWVRVRETIEKTREVSAQSLATIFFWTNETFSTTQSFFNYVRALSDKCPEPTPEESAADDKTTVEKDIESQRNSYEDSWKRRSPPRE